MRTRRAQGRTCRSYERPWGDYCVDQNLEDGWLERLNALKAWKLIGVCEGHADRRPRSTGRYPNINLRLKDALLPHLSNSWPDLRSALFDEINTRFLNSETRLSVEVVYKLRVSRGKLVYQETMTLKARSYRGRAGAEMDAATRAWFEDVVTELEHLDDVTLGWYQERGCEVPLDNRK